MLAFNRGRLSVMHQGCTNGFVAHVALYPKEQLGIVILANLNTLRDFIQVLEKRVVDILWDYSSATESDNREWRRWRN